MDTVGPMSVDIRCMEAADHAGVLGVAEALPEWFDPDARRRAIPIDIRHQRGFVAVANGQVLGFITLFVAEGRLNIGWLGVRPECHGRGIGTRLLAAAETYAQQQGLAEIATWTLGDGVDYKPYEATRTFYFRRGFVVYQRSQTDNPGCPEEIRIRKVIAPKGH
jgi:GNAT superfamily N-acetyltransferase